MDILKGLAIYLVIVSHLAYELLGENIVTQLVSIVHVPLFFVVSGYLYYGSYIKKSTIEMIKTRVLKFLKVYIIWSFVAFLFSLLMNIKKINYGFVRKELYEIFIQGRSVWFILILAFINLFYICFIYVFKKYTGNIIVICYSLLYIIQFIILPNSIFQLYKYKLHLLYFGVGILIRKYQCEFVDIKVKINHSIIYISCIIGLVMYIISPLDNYMVDFKAPIKAFPQIILIIFLSLMCLLSIYFIVEKLKTCKISCRFAKMGIISLDMYLLHMVFVKFILLLINRFLNYIYIPKLFVELSIFIIGYMVAEIIIIIKEYILNKLLIYKYMI